MPTTFLRLDSPEEIEDMMREAARVDALFQSGLLAPRPSELPSAWGSKSKDDQLLLPF
jgi:hypothetical protein